MTRALGVRRAVEPDLAELTPAEGDIFVMCTDGLTGHLRDQEIAERISLETDLQESCDALVTTANERGGEDNTTVVVIRFEKDGESDTL